MVISKYEKSRGCYDSSEHKQLELGYNDKSVPLEKKRKEKDKKEKIKINIPLESLVHKSDSSLCVCSPLSCL